MELALQMNSLSIECVDDPDGLPGVIVYEDKTFPISSQQVPAFGAERGLYSSVRPFQYPPLQLDDEVEGPPDLNLPGGDTYLLKTSPPS